MRVHFGATWGIRLIESSVCGDDAGGDAAFMSNYFDHLFDNVSREAVKMQGNRSATGASPDRPPSW